MIDKSTLNASRSLYYCLLSKLFVFGEDAQKRFFGVSEIIDILVQNPLDENSKKALQNLQKVFKDKNEESLVEEFNNIFYLPNSKTVKNTASYYDEKIESGKKLVEVRNFLAKTKIRRNEKIFKEPEDSVGFLFVFMNELIELIRAENKEYENLQHCLFVEIINPFIDTFTNELFNNEESYTYKDVAIILNAFMDFERLYFEVEKPSTIDLSSKPKFSRSKEEEIEKNRARKRADKKSL